MGSYVRIMNSSRGEVDIRDGVSKIRPRTQNDRGLLGKRQMAFWHPADLGRALAAFALALGQECQGGRQQHRRPGMYGHSIGRNQICQNDDAEEIPSHPAISMLSFLPVFMVFVHRYFDTNISNKSSQ